MSNIAPIYKTEPTRRCQIKHDYRRKKLQSDLVTLTYDLWPPKTIGLLPVLISIHVSNLVSISQAVFELSCASRTEPQTNRWNGNRRLRTCQNCSQWYGCAYKNNYLKYIKSNFNVWYCFLVLVMCQSLKCKAVFKVKFWRHQWHICPKTS